MKAPKTPTNSRPNALRSKVAAAAVAFGLAAAACVTVNVNFPEATVQKATDDYVRDLYRAKEKGRAPSPEASPASKPTSMLDALLVTSAYAAEAVFKVDSDKAFAIKEKLAAQVDQIITKKRAGALGETNDGLLTLDQPGGKALKPLVIKTLQPVVDKENELRNQLYQEVLASNGINKARLKDIQKSFARSFQAESPSGTWLQDSEGKWAQKP